VAPYFKSGWKALPWALAAAVCLSRVYLGAHFPLDVAAGAGLGMFIGGVLNLVFGVPGNRPRTARASGLPCGSRARRIRASLMLLRCPFGGVSGCSRRLGDLSAPWKWWWAWWVACQW